MDCDVSSLRRYVPFLEGWPIRRLTLYPTDDQDADVLWLRERQWLSRIESLSLAGRQVRREAWGRAMLGSPHLSRLRELEVAEENVGEVAGVLAGSASSPTGWSHSICSRSRAEDGKKC